MAGPATWRSTRLFPYTPLTIYTSSETNSLVLFVVATVGPPWDLHIGGFQCAKL